MIESNQVTSLLKFSKQLVNLAEKRAVLKAELTGLKGSRKNSKTSARRAKLTRDIRQLSGKMEELYSDLARPTPRRVERWVGLMPITLLVETSGDKFEHRASTVDLSKRGLRIRTTASLTAGQTLDVYSPTGRLGHCRVVWVTGAGDERPGEVGLEILK